MLTTVVVLDAASFSMFTLEADQATLDRLDDEENYYIIDPKTKQVFINKEWITIPAGRIQADGQLVVTNAG